MSRTRTILTSNVPHETKICRTKGEIVVRVTKGALRENDVYTRLTTSLSRRFEGALKKPQQYVHYFTRIPMITFPTFIFKKKDIFLGCVDTRLLTQRHYDFFVRVRRTDVKRIEVQGKCIIALCKRMPLSL